MSGAVRGSDLVGRSVSVEVPATTANLGAGFDALALALDLSNRVRVEAVEGDSQPLVHVDVLGEGAGHLPTGKRNRFVSALNEGLRAGGFDGVGVGWRVRMENDIPVARGLGSSAAATVAALMAADAFLEGALGSDLMLALAAASEGHADNAAAALYGGLCVVTDVAGAPRAVRIEPPGRLLAALYIPDTPLSTAAMRAVLPPTVPFDDAVHNVGATALAVAAFSQDRLDLLAAATEDRLHEPYRAGAYAELPELISAARSAGSLGACLSGAGSTVIAFSDDAAAAERVVAAMQARADELELPGRGLVRSVRGEGARLIDDPGDRPQGAVAELT